MLNNTVQFECNHSKGLKKVGQTLVERAKLSVLTSERCQNVGQAIDTLRQPRVRIFEQTSPQFILVPVMNHFVNGEPQHLGKLRIHLQTQQAIDLSSINLHNYYYDIYDIQNKTYNRNQYEKASFVQSMICSNGDISNIDIQ